MSLTFILAESWRGVRRQGRLMFAVTVSVALTLTLIGGAWLAAMQVEKLKGYWYDKVEVSVFLCGTSSDAAACPTGEVNDEERDAVEQALEGLSQTKAVFYESKDDAWTRFAEQYEGQRILEEVSVETMPESYRVKLHDPETFVAVAEAVADLPGVEKVQDQRQLLAPLFRFVATLQNLALGLALAQVLVAVLLVSSTVRVAAHSRRHEIAAMRLVGAAPRMVRAPFMGEAALAGLAGGAVSMAGVWAFCGYAMPAILETWGVNASGVGGQEFAVVLPTLLAAGTLVPMIVTAFVLRRHMKV